MSAGSSSENDGQHPPGAISELSLDLVGELLGFLAHDLRNPLAALHSNLGFLESCDVTRDYAEAVQDGLISCESLKHMIDNVDLIARELRGQLGQIVESTQVWPVVVAAANACQQAAQSHGVRLVLEAPDWPREPLVRGSPNLIQRLVANLLHNSIQHSIGGGEIEVALVSGDRLLIEDSGPPLPTGLGEQAFTALGQTLNKVRRGGRYSRAFGLYCAGLAARYCGALVTSLPAARGNRFEVQFRRAS